ncbi:hypothetical protein MTR67_031558 [Solanum verrucosum]|uniref:Uncharacterized protein n=1 Tax=Solanum verrucosum TaxID=315347 RepID=A0AAF0U2P3_SOLVR|nr:hypothetical protein MTR67_031558 [Solanum verrucosum]
MRRFLFRS